MQRVTAVRKNINNGEFDDDKGIGSNYEGMRTIYEIKAMMTTTDNNKMK